MGIRNAAKAIILEGGNLLVLKMQEHGSTYYILPGGGQEHGETLHEAVKRECMEELGADVEVGELLFVREYIGKNHEFARKHAHAHQTEFIFLCHLKKEEFQSGTNPDQGQVGTEWLPVDRLLEYPLYPLALRSHLISYVKSGTPPIYVGDIN